MNPTIIKRCTALFAISLLTLVAHSGVLAQKKTKARQGEPVLWQRVNIKRQDTFYGPGGRSNQPDITSVTFIKEEKGGHSKKYRIRDADGRVWVAKVGDEAQSETAAVRLLSAIGYKTEVNYLVPRLTIPGVGTFSNVRLEARPEGVERDGEWKWGRSPFENTRQMKGLMLMMAFLNNWDMKSANNVILSSGGIRDFAISDLGVSFGKTGSNGWPIIWRFGRSRNKPMDYARSTLVKEVKGNKVKIHYNGKNRSRMKDFTVADVRWLADLLNQLSDEQIRAAFRAANYSSADVDLLTRAVKNRIGQLNAAALGGGRFASM